MTAATYTELTGEMRRVLAALPTDEANVRHGHQPRGDGAASGAALDDLVAAGYARVDGVVARPTPEGFLAEAGRDPKRMHLDTICAVTGLREPDSRHIKFRARRDGQRWIAEIGTGEYTTHVGAYDTDGAAQHAGRSAVEDARDELIAEWRAACATGDLVELLAGRVSDLPVRSVT